MLEEWTERADAAPRARTFLKKGKQTYLRSVLQPGQFFTTVARDGSLYPFLVVSWPSSNLKVVGFGDAHKQGHPSIQVYEVREQNSVGGESSTVTVYCVAEPCYVDIVSVQFLS